MENCYKDLAVNDDALREVLQAMALLQPDQAFQVQPLTGGVSSNILKVCIDNHQFCLKQALPKLKVAKEWYAPLDRVFAEIDWLSVAATIVPGAIPHLLGVDKQARCFAMSYLPQESYSNWKAKLLAAEMDEHIAVAVADILVKLHAQTINNADYAKQFAYDDSFYALRLEPYLVETARVHPELSAYITPIIERTQNHKLALVHGDISPKNILLGPHGPVILDAECAWYGDPAFDLAFCLNHLLLKAVLMPAYLEPLMSAYAAMATTYLAKVTWEDSAAFEARVATLLPCLTLARVDGKSPAEYLNAEHGEIIRRVTTQLIKNGIDRLDTINTIWKKEIVK